MAIIYQYWMEMWEMLLNNILIDISIYDYLLIISIKQISINIRILSI